MKLTPDDPRLSAYLLGELPPAEAAAVERAIAADPALKLSFGELKKVATLLEGTLSTAPPGLRPAQREAILKAGRHADSQGSVVEFASTKPGGRPWLAALGAAAAVVLAVTLVSKFAGPARRTAGGDDGAAAISLLPLPGPRTSGGASAAGGGSGETEASQADQLADNPAAYLEKLSRHLTRDPLPDPSRLPALKPLPALQSSVKIDLPVLIGHASYGWVRGWIRERGELPPKQAVRIEELVNTFPLPVEPAEKVASAIETAACPWNPEHVLVAATVLGAKDRETSVKWSFEAADGTRVRMLASPGSRAAKLPDRLPGGRATTVLLEVEPAAGSEPLGVLKLAAGGELSEMTVRMSGGEPSPAMRQLGLVAAFGMWLRGEGIDAPAMEAALKQAGRDDDPGRADTRQLVRQALDLAAAGR